MFPYDPAILAAVQVNPQNIADVFKIMQTIDATASMRTRSSGSTGCI
jgi:hypothetical protein